MRYTRSLYIIFIFLLPLWGCENKDSNKLPADIIYNPNSAQNNGDAGLLPEMTFSTNEHDFGRVIQGEVVTYAFRFTNTGKNNLLISGVSTSCGCTISKYTEDPVKPGQQGTVEVTFDSSGRKGFQRKTITVTTNTQPNSHTLSIKAKVVTPES